MNNIRVDMNNIDREMYRIIMWVGRIIEIRQNNIMDMPLSIQII